MHCLKPLLSPHHSLCSHDLRIIAITLLFVKQVLIRLIGADEYLYSNYMDSTKWLEHLDVLEMILDKFSSSVSALSVFLLFDGLFSVESA